MTACAVEFYHDAETTSFSVARRNAGKANNIPVVDIFASAVERVMNE